MSSSSESGDDIDIKGDLEDEVSAGRTSLSSLPSTHVLMPPYPFAQEDTSLANSDVTTKYQEAAKIANAVLESKKTKISPC